MNSIYNVIYSPALGCMIVVSEFAKSKGKGKDAISQKRIRRALLPSLSLCSLLVSSALAFPLLANDLPAGATVVSGSGSITTNGSAMTVNQSSHALITNWQSFSIGANNTVTFNQPSSTSVALNRVVGQDASKILGNLNANGQVFLLNPNGIVIGNGGSVQTGGFVASTLNLSNEDFLAENYHFTGTSTSNGAIVNNGSISAGANGSANGSNNGIVALIAPSVTNGEAGTITGANSSTNSTDVTLAAGTDVLLDFDGDGLISIEVQASTVSTLVDNQGLIQADGGLVVLSAQGASDALKGVVNNTGTIQANTITNKDGRIYLLADMAYGEINAEGTLEANFVETSAATLNISENLTVNTNGGEWLIDPVNITIDDSKATAIENALASGDVTVSTEDGAVWGSEMNSTGTDEGNITVDSAINWSSNILTLRADNDININATLNSTGTSATDGLILKYAQTTSTGTYNISSPVNLAAGSLFQTRSGSDAALTYTVITDLGEEGSTTGTDLQGINGGVSGNYVLGANIDASDTENWDNGEGFNPIWGSPSVAFSGIFDGLGHTISNLTINRPTINSVGLFGYTSGSIIQNIGLIDVNITGYGNVGGLVGQHIGGTISNSYVTGNVILDSVGYFFTGGLVGYNTGTISNSYAAASVSGRYSVGGLVGGNTGTISNSYATGAVSSSADEVGGLAGTNEGTISNSYAIGTVSGTNSVGGLVGRNIYGYTISTSYATGSVSGSGSNIGGLVGYNQGSVTSGYYDTDTTGQSDTGKGTGISTSTALTSAAYAGFDFTNDWFMAEGSTRPFLRSEYSTTVTNTHQLQLMAMDLSADYIVSNNIDFGDTFTDSSRSDMWATSYNGSTYIGAGFSPIGDDTNNFTGGFDGLGYTISGLVIHRSSETYVGLFAVTTDAIIKDVGLIDVNVEGYQGVGGLVGSERGSSSISNSYVTGSVSGSYNFVGGLVGSNTNSSSITNSYAMVSVSGNNTVGGLMGYNSGTVTNSYATGSVSGVNYIGGLAGSNANIITNSYAMGSVSGSTYVGGMVGQNYASSTVTNSYAAGSVSGSADVGGLVGRNLSSVVTNSYYDKDTTGQSDTGRGEGLTTAEMQDPFTFIDAGWDVASAWGKSTTDENSGYMMLQWQDASLYGDYIKLSGNTTTTYGLLADVSGISVSGVGVGVDNVTLNWGSTVTATTDAGSYDYNGANVLNVTTTSSGGVYVDYGTNTLIINKAAITLSVADITRIYDGTTDATGTALVSSGSLYGTDSLSGGSFSFTDKNAGTDKTVTVAGITIDDGNSGNNYAISYADNTTSTINQAAISAITGITADDKTYDGTTTVTLDTDSALFTGMIAGDMLSIDSATGAFSDANVGVDKTVAVSGITLGGTDAGNYVLADTTATTTADIKQVATSVSTGTITKVPFIMPVKGNLIYAFSSQLLDSTAELIQVDYVNTEDTTTNLIWEEF